MDGWPNWDLLRNRFKKIIKSHFKFLYVFLAEVTLLKPLWFSSKQSIANLVPTVGFNLLI